MTKIQSIPAKEYWEKRYAKGGDSGPGSQGEAARLKAKYINKVLQQPAIRTVVEWGCGDGQQLSLFDLNSVEYLGIEVSETALCRCMLKCPWSSYVLWSEDFQMQFKADLSMSIDVLYHLVDHKEYSYYLKRLFNSAMKYVLIHSTDKDEESNLHVRHRKISDDIRNMFLDWELIDKEKGVGDCQFFLYRRLP